MSLPIFLHFKNTEENSRLSPVTENCNTSIHQVPSMLKEQRLVPLNLLNSSQKKPLAPAHPHLGPSGGSEEQCWDHVCQHLLPSYWGSLPEVMLGSSHIQLWGRSKHRPVFAFPLKGFAFFFLHEEQIELSYHWSIFLQYLPRTTHCSVFKEILEWWIAWSVM